MLSPTVDEVTLVQAKAEKNGKEELQVKRAALLSC